MSHAFHFYKQVTNRSIAQTGLLSLLFCMLIVSLFYLNDIFIDNMILF